ncbi:sigma-70 family RNA polymerase sigma factor [Euzebya sp.]|uniref:sigma-70 family RNA polymerase sigma factor n=1 Tax=Euzebya sp. TaxID=1971409 RepID=UPI00351655AE
MDAPAQSGVRDEELVVRARRGDGVALDALLVRYRPVVRARARRYHLAGADRDDVVQEGMVGLYKAIRDFAPDGVDGRPASFRTFAELCVVRQILTAVRAATRDKHLLLNAAVPLHPDLPLPADRPGSGDPAEDLIRRAEAEVVGRVVRQLLSDLEVAVLAGLADGHRYAEIAEALGVTDKAIDNARQRIRRKLDGPLRHARARDHAA